VAKRSSAVVKPDKPAARASGKPASKTAAKPASKTVSKTVSKPASKAPAKPVAKAPAKATSKAPATKAAAPATASRASKVVAKAEPKVAKVAAKAEPKAAAKVEPKAAAKVESKATAKPAATQKPVAATRPEKPPEKPAAVAARPVAKAPVKAPVRKPAKPADDDSDDDGDFREAPTQASRNTIDMADVIRYEPEAPPAPRKKSVLEVAEEDEDFEEDPPLPTADDIHGLLDRLRKAAQYGGDALEDLPRLIEQLEQIDDPNVMPRLLGLLEDNDPYGIYWNVLYVLEKFDDAYLKALLGSIEALHARAPDWAYTCIIRILNTRGDEDDCTAAFERLVNDGGAETRALVLKVLRELSADTDTDHEQKQNIARTVTAIGGNVSSTAADSGSNSGSNSGDSSGDNSGSNSGGDTGSTGGNTGDESPSTAD